MCVDGSTMCVLDEIRLQKDALAAKVGREEPKPVLNHRLDGLVAIATEYRDVRPLRSTPGDMVAVRLLNGETRRGREGDSTE